MGDGPFNPSSAGILVGKDGHSFRVHVRIEWPAIFSRVVVAPGNWSEPRLVPHLLEGVPGYVLGDRGYWQLLRTADLRERGIALLTPFSTQEQRSLARIESLDESQAVPDRDRDQLAGRTLCRASGVGTGLVASLESSAPRYLDAYRSRVAQSPSRSTTPAICPSRTLNPAPIFAHRVINCSPRRTGAHPVISVASRTRNCSRLCTVEITSNQASVLRPPSTRDDSGPLTESALPWNQRHP